MTRPEKAILIIPAYNEGENIPVSLAYALSLKCQGVVREVLVVDDGSEDRTAEVSRALGAEVIRLENNIGKGGAFLEAALHCKKKGADVIVLLDADMISAREGHIVAMLDKLHANDSGAKPYMMAVAPAAEGNAKPTHRFSGERAIKMDSLNFLFVNKGGEWAHSVSLPAQRFRKMSSGYGLEVALEWQIKNAVRLDVLEAFFKLHEAFRKGGYVQGLEVGLAGQIELDRQHRADLLRIARRRINKQRALVGATKRATPQRQAISA